MNGILIFLLVIIAGSEVAIAVTAFFNLLESIKFTRKRDDNERSFIKIQQESMDTVRSTNFEVKAQNAILSTFTQETNKVLGEFNERIKNLESKSKPAKKITKKNSNEPDGYDVTKDKGRITVRNIEDTPKTRKKLNPDAEKLDKENGIKK